jgi:hypothetical protein
MADKPSPPSLSAEAAATLTEFARACKAAARAVSLYPGGHPAITSSLGRLAQLTARMAEKGPYRIEIMPGTLLVDRAVMPKADAGVTELADLLHRHLIGALTVNAGADAASWRTLLLLLARTPEDVRSDGGIRHLWATAGGPSLEIEEIDYAEVLREKQGVATAVEQIISAALAGTHLELDDSGMRLLLDLVQNPAKLDELMTQLDEASVKHGADVQAAAFVGLLRGLAVWLSKNQPQRLDPMLAEMGRAAGRLSAEVMLKLLDERSKGNLIVGGINVAGEVVQRMTDESVSQFVARSVITERGASERLAHAFQALVPDVDRQRRLLGLAEQEVRVAESANEAFAELWARVENMLTSYSDETYVSEQYARELSTARGRAIDVERTSDDPPERIASWLTSVSDGSLRSLDHQLLLDLLTIEADHLRWRDVADTVATHAEDLIRVGYFEQAWQLAGALVSEGERNSARRPHAAVALERFGRGTMMKHVPGHLRAAGDDSYERFRALCHAIGPAVIPALAEVLASEQDARARRRLRDTLLGFGAKGRESVRQLMNAPNWEVRRTAAYLLREFGGTEGLKELIPLLTDSEPLVRHEAVQGLVMSGSDEASKSLHQAITSAAGRTRERLINELTGLRDDRAAALFAYLIRHMDRRIEQRLYLSAIETLGTFGGTDAVEALKLALYQGTWWSPLRTRRLRTAAATALRRIGTAAAIDVLREAAARGALGVRAAARAQLADVG